MERDLQRGNGEEAGGIETDLQERPKARPERGAPTSRTAGAKRRDAARWHALARVCGQLIWSFPPEQEPPSDALTWRSFTGQSGADAAADGWLDAIHPEDRARTAAAWAQARATQNPYEIEHRIRRADGIYRTFLTRGVPLPSKHDEPATWVGTCTDITERRELEARLAATAARASISARHMEGVCQLVEDALFFFDRDGHIIEMNAAAEGLVARTLPPGQRGASLSGEPGPRIGDARGRELAREEWPLLRLLSSEHLREGVAGEYVVPTLDGQRLIFRFTGRPLTDERGTVIGAVALCRDMGALRDLEHRTRAALDALLEMAEALVSSGPATEESPASHVETRLSATAVARNLAELTRSVLGCDRVGINTIEAGTDISRPAAVAGLSPEQEREWWETQPAETRLAELPDQALVQRLRAGEVILVDVTRPPYADQPNPLGARVVLVAPMRIAERLIGMLALDYGGAEHDYKPDELSLAGGVAKLMALVFERERLQRERAEAEGNALALREANRRMDEFLVVVTHELRTPLTSVRGGLDLALRRLGELPREVAISTRLRSPLERAARKAQTLERLVSDLVDMSRIQENKLHLRLVPLELAALVRAGVEEQRQEAPNRIIQLKLPDRPVRVVADAERVSQVLANFLTNALKFSAEEQPVEVALRVTAGQARVSVRDHGAGIAAADLEHIWERFYRAQGTPVQSGAGIGLGLGLFISQTIIERLEGQIGAESVPGDGATFWFTLPLRDA